MKKIKEKIYFFAFSIFGRISPPDAISKYHSPDSPAGLFTFLNNLVKILIAGAGLFTLFNLIFAGYGFINAGGRSEAIEAAWAKIWQSLLGMIIVASSIVIAGVAGVILYGDASALLVPKLYSP